jgi:hypothetical protein
MTLESDDHSRPSPAAPYVPTAPYVVTGVVVVEADQPVQAPSVHTHQGVTNVEVEFQANTDMGIVFGAAPLRVLSITQPIPSLAREGTHIEGYYFISLRLPGLEIKNVVQALELSELITVNRHLTITLVVSSHPPPTNGNGCHYKHDLPATNNLGIHFSGFPAKTQSVDPNSPMAGKIHPGQSVYAVIVPGLADLTMQSGGFTGSRVAEHLQTHWHVPHKQLVVTTHQPSGPIRPIRPIPLIGPLPPIQAIRPILARADKKCSNISFWCDSCECITTSCVRCGCCEDCCIIL